MSFRSVMFLQFYHCGLATCHSLLRKEQLKSQQISVTQIQIVKYCKLRTLPWSDSCIQISQLEVQDPKHWGRKSHSNRTISAHVAAALGPQTGRAESIDGTVSQAVAPPDTDCKSHCFSLSHTHCLPPLQLSREPRVVQSTTYFTRMLKQLDQIIPMAISSRIPHGI